tara:strand:- start:66 stop:863 length:798 start_codon:yes stop_codon:yes gene_type:complete
MIDIFTERILYPYQENILDYFKDYYNTGFIALIPFFKIDSYNNDNKNFTNFEFLESKSSLFLSVRANNQQYPSDLEKYERGEIITWENIINGSDINDKSDVLKALRTNSGFYRPVFKRPDLMNKLNDYTSKKKIWQPTEGVFDVFSKISIYKTLKLLNKKKIVIEDVFREESRIINIENLTEIDFINSLNHQDEFLYSEDKEILFAIDSDSFFFLILANNDIMNLIISANLFEGFKCEQDTKDGWEFNLIEQERLNRIEKQQENK